MRGVLETNGPIDLYDGSRNGPLNNLYGNIPLTQTKYNYWLMLLQIAIKQFFKATFNLGYVHTAGESGLNLRTIHLKCNNPSF